MLVKELIEHLQKLDPELEVYTAKDEEGNGYNQTYFAPSEEYAFIDGREIDVLHPDDVGTEYDKRDLTRIVVI